MALLPAGRAIAKTWVSAARTSDQGLRPRMIDHFNEQASRATRWALFALRRYRRNAPPGVGLPFVLRQIEGKQESRSWGDGRDGRGYQLCAVPTPLTEEAIAALPCEILLSLVVFLPSVFALVLRATSLERRKREKPARGKSLLLLLCVVRAHSSA
jgi:hypothetical protein